MADESLKVRPVPAHMLVASWRDSFFIADMLSGLARHKLRRSEPMRSCSAERACRAQASVPCGLVSDPSRMSGDSHDIGTREPGGPTN